MNFVHLLKIGAKFVIAIPFGGLLGAGIVIIGHPISSIRELALAVLGVGGAFTIFGAYPAAAFGIPALLILRKLGLARIPASGAMSVGGAVFGAVIAESLLDEAFTGAVAGGSIGLTLGLLVYQRRSRPDVAELN